MAEALLGVAVEVTVSKLISIAGEQINLAWGFNDELQELRSTLELLNAFLQDADQKKLDPPVKLWLQGLAEIASDADDLLEDIRYESLRRQVEIGNKLRKKVSNFFSHNPIAFRLKMANKIKDINSSFTDKSNKATQLGLLARLPQAETAHASQIEESHGLIGDSHLVVGREADCSKVVDLLIKSSSTSGHALGLGVVAVVGMAGLGKTTLAKLAFNDERLKSHFDATIWVCVSGTFDVKVILRHALECLTDESVASLETKHKILMKLREKLEDKKSFLLVLDDVWNRDTLKWNELMEDLLGLTRKAKECAILATTRDMEVATTMGLPMEFTYALAILEDEACWSIIKAICCGVGSSSHHVLPTNLEKIGREIARKCEGLPLLAKVIGGTLRKEKNEQAWASIQENVLRHSLGSNADQRIIRALQLSFDRLGSPCMKKCFAFCSIFQDDHLFLKEDLIQLWMASGFIHPSAHDTAWIIGNRYFNDLVSNCLFQDIERDSYGNIIACKMHDMVRSFAKSLSEAKILTSNGSVPSDVSNVCHLNLEGKETHLGQTLKLFSRQNLRTLFAQFNIFRYNGLEFTRLRILSFAKSNVDIEELPSSIGNLKRLTYFDISETAIKEIPRSFTRLYNLETLKLVKCPFIKKLPEQMDNLVNLMHLIINMEEVVPVNISRLTCLQTLPIFAVGSERGHGIEELGSLAKLQGKLKISKLELVGGEEEARMAKLVEKSGIFKLVLKWSSERENNEHDVAVLEGLQPNPSLKGLKINNSKGHKFPTWISSLGNLVELELKSCNGCVKLPSLGRLPNLTRLHIDELINVRSLDEDFFCNGNFPSLKTFLLFSMQSLEDLMKVETKITFPSLEKLVFFQCPKLKGIPWTDGLPSLQSLDISDCQELRYLRDGLSSFMQLKRLEISDCSNLKSIPSPWGASSLEDLTLIRCEEVRSASRLENRSCPSLKHLEVQGCPGMRSEIERMLGQFSWLKSLSIDVISSSDDVWEFCPFFNSLESLELNGYKEGEKIKSILPDHIQELTSLKKLEISKFSSLEDLPELPSLQHLGINSCPNLKNVQCISRMPKLKVMRIGQTSEEVEFPPYFDSIFDLSSPFLEKLTLYASEHWTCLPSQMQNLTSLKELEIWTFEAMEALPEWIGSLSSLERLDLIFCRNLMHMPSQHSMQRLSKLKSLTIMGCPKLLLLSATSSSDQSGSCYFYLICIKGSISSFSNKFQNQSSICYGATYFTQPTLAMKIGETKMRAKALADEIGAWHLGVCIDSVLSSLISLFQTLTGNRPRYKIKCGETFVAEHSSSSQDRFSFYAGIIVALGSQ